MLGRIIFADELLADIGVMRTAQSASLFSPEVHFQQPWRSLGHGEWRVLVRGGFY